MSNNEKLLKQIKIQKISAKNRRYKEEPSGNFRAEKCINQNENSVDVLNSMGKELMNLWKE